MSGQQLFTIVGLVDDDLIEEAESYSPATTMPWKKWAGWAACAALVCSLGFAWFATGGFGGFASSSPQTGGSSGAPGHEAGASYLSYAGPVLPLTTETDTALEADRAVTYKLNPNHVSQDTQLWDAEVTDSYVLNNLTGETIATTALYPFVGNLDELVSATPTLSVNGTAVETELYAGSYAGGFTGIEPDDNASYNLKHASSYADYEALLADGTYQAAALSATPALTQAVTVYELTDCSAPVNRYPAATQSIGFTIDTSATQILTYGFEGLSWDADTGWMQYSFFVPDAQRMTVTPKLLVVLGEDIGDYTLQGYENGSCETKLSGVTATIARKETTLDAVLDRLCQDYLQQYDSGTYAASGTAYQLFRSAVAHQLTQYGTLSFSGVDRYENGMLEDILSEARVVDRVFYLAFPLTVEPADSVTVSAVQLKAASFDFACDTPADAGVEGYDLASTLGSALRIRSLAATLELGENQELVRQNFGFAPEKGIFTVTLDPATPCYFMEIRSKV